MAKMAEASYRELDTDEIAAVSGGVVTAPVRWVWRQIMIMSTIALVNKVGQQIQDAASELK